MKINKKFILTIFVILLAITLIAPGAVVTKMARVKAGETITVGLGNAGAMWGAPYYSGRAVLSRYESANYNHRIDFTFAEKLLDVRFINTDGYSLRTVLGPVYVYFNLKQRELKKFDQGFLSIYFFDTWKSSWVKCPTYLTSDHGTPRATCRIHAYGLYGLGVEGSYKAMK